jgi:transmembrane sensor
MRSRLDTATAEAVQWVVRLRSGDSTADCKAAFEAWRREDPAHAAAADRVSDALGSFDLLKRRGVPNDVVRAAIVRADRRAALRSAFMWAGMGTLASWTGWNAVTEGALLADRSTGLAQRENSALPDGSDLLLDAKTSIDVDFDNGRRHVTLRQGRMLARVAAVPQRPLTIATPHGAVTTNDSTLVAEARGRSSVAVIAGSASFSQGPASGTQLAAGTLATIVDERGLELRATRGIETLWTRGLIALDDEPVAALVEALQPYRAGVLRADAHAAAMRISGVFSLDDTDRTLAALERTQPLRVVRLTRYVVTITAV